MQANTLLLQRVLAPYFKWLGRPLTAARRLRAPGGPVAAVDEWLDPAPPPGVLVAERLEAHPELETAREELGVPGSEYTGRRVYLLKDRRFVVAMVSGHELASGRDWHESEAHFAFQRGEVPALDLDEAVATLRRELLRAGIRSAEVDLVEDVLASHGEALKAA